MYWDSSTRKVTKCPTCQTGAAAPSTPTTPTEGAVKRIAPREVNVVLPASNEEARAAFDVRWNGLDPEQRAMASWRPGDGNVQGVAAAGSGKTATMVALVGRLLWDEVVRPNEIIVTTFTAKAGKELVERLARVLPLGAIDPAGSNPGALRAGTFHGLALRALRRESIGRWDMSRCLDIGGPGRSAAVPGTKLLWSKVLGYAGETGLPGTGASGLDLEDADVRAYTLAVDVARAHGHRGEALRAALVEIERDQGLPDLAQAWDLVCAVKFALGAWDFADVLEAYLDGLRTGAISDGAKVVIVDEAQDNNRVQIETATLLAKNSGGEVIFVGDLRQSIYSWRGAEPALFRDAAKSLSATMMELPHNYRSAKSIVALGNEISRGKPWSLGADADAHRADEGLITVKGYDDPAHEAEVTAEEIGLAITNGAPASDYAILVRTNAMAGSYEAALVAAKIPCVVVGGTPFFARKEVKDVLAYVALSQRDDVEAFARIINRPRRFLGKKFVAQVEAAMRGGRDLLSGLSIAAGQVYRRQAEAAHELRALLITLRATPWPDVVESIASVLAPIASGEAGEADDDRSGIPAAVASVAATFSSCDEFLAFATKCAGEVAEAAEGEQVEGRVTISTLHKAKGLEWKVVFLSASDGVFPHVRATGERRQEEERLFYVGATRARDTLHLTYANLNLRGQEAGPSRFLNYAHAVMPGEAPVEVEEGEEVPAGTLLPADEFARGGTAEATETTDAGAHLTSVAALSGDDDEEVTPKQRPAQPAAPAGGPGVETMPTVEQAAPALFGAEAWERATKRAALLTESEPHATEGEGGRYVEVKASSFDDLLGAGLGFHRRPAEGTQRVWERSFTKGAGSVVVRVYSTIPVGADSARDLGEDSIKVAAVYEEHREAGDLVKPLHKKLPYAARTRGWRVTLLNRIAEIAVLVVGPVCPKCSAPMAKRTAMKAEGAQPFLGCVKYPACHGTRRLS